MKLLNESIIKIRVELQNSKIKKSGKNSHAGFEYYELADFLPKLNELMLKENVNDNYTIENGEAILTLVKEDEKQSYKMPFTMFEVPMTKSGSPMMQEIQYLGALNTYYKRYLYLNAFGITDGEVIDSLDNNQIVKKDKMVSEPQLKLLARLNEEQVAKVLEKYNVTKLEELTMKNASEIIEKIKASQQTKGE